ncbi:MAG TPA: hypothetical protein ENI82_06785, partial [Bacteroidetes bacterium]|nr:hypothetical protein [Bacteroidota bacterium]
MYKILSISFLLCLFFTHAISQKPKILLSPEFHMPKTKLLEGHLHSNSSGHYIYFKKLGGLTGNKVSYILEKYDNNFKNIFSKEYKANKRNIYGKEIKYFKNKFAWLLYERNSKSNYLEYFIRPIDMIGKSLSNKPIAKLKYKNVWNLPTTKWKVSKDTSSILFIAENDNDRKNENYEVYLSVIDGDFDKIWSKKIKLPFSQKRVDVISWELTNDGKVFFVAKIYGDDWNIESKKSRDKKQKIPAYDIALYSMNAEMSKPTKYKLKLNDAFAKEVKLHANNDNDLTCVGFFGDSSSGPIHGVFYMKLSRE